MSEIRATTISDSAGTGPITLTKQSATKAWSNFDQYFTNTIRDSFAVSSVSDDGTGTSTVNFTTAFGGANYCCNFSGGLNNSYRAVVSGDVGSNYKAGSMQILVRQSNSTSTSLDIGCVFSMYDGDLA